MYIIVTEPLDQDESFETRELDRDGVEWFEMPVLRFDRYHKQVIKKVIVRKISYDDFSRDFKIADVKVKRKFVSDSLIVSNHIKAMEGRSEYLNA